MALLLHIKLRHFLDLRHSAIPPVNYSCNPEVQSAEHVFVLSTQFKFYTRTTGGSSPAVQAVQHWPLSFRRWWWLGPGVLFYSWNSRFHCLQSNPGRKRSGTTLITYNFGRRFFSTRVKPSSSELLRAMNGLRCCCRSRSLSVSAEIYHYVLDFLQLQRYHHPHQATCLQH